LPVTISVSIISNIPHILYGIYHTYLFLLLKLTINTAYPFAKQVTGIKKQYRKHGNMRNIRHTANQAHAKANTQAKKDTETRLRLRLKDERT